MKKKNRIVIYGKGGIGKSMIAANLSMVYARKGRKVLQVGCDPKHDSTLWLLRDRKEMRTVMERLTAQGGADLAAGDILMKGKEGVGCIECGGPAAGVGCAGRGITLMFDVLTKLGLMNSYDMVIFDVLGDVVCGGFAAPLKLDFADKVFVAVSEEFASLYAANNIARAVAHYAYNGVYLAGLILNLRDNRADTGPVCAFARRLKAPLLAVVPRSGRIAKADFEKKTVVEKYPHSDEAGIFSSLAKKILKCRRDPRAQTVPLDEETLYGLFS